MLGQTLNVPKLEFAQKNLDKLSLNDFDISGSGNIPELFRIPGELHFNGLGKYSLTIQMILDYNGKEIVTLNTKKIDNVKSARIFNLSNRKIQARNGVIKVNTTNGKQNIVVGHINIDDSFFSSSSVPTSTLPGGVYTLKLKIKLGRKEVERVARIKVQSNFLIDLIHPMNSKEITTKTPRFEWFTENKYKKLELLVYKIPENSRSLSDVLSGQPVLRKFLKRNERSFTYPATERALESGQVYAWTVHGFIQTLSGRKKVRAPIYKFRYVKPGTSGDIDNKVHELLKELLGSNYDNFRKDFEGYKVDKVRLNGKKASLTKLYELLKEYQKGNKKIMVEYN
jgi:hypothetical protein